MPGASDGQRGWRIPVMVVLVQHHQARTLPIGTLGKCLVVHHIAVLPWVEVIPHHGDDVVGRQTVDDGTIVVNTTAERRIEGQPPVAADIELGKVGPIERKNKPNGKRAVEFVVIQKHGRACAGDIHPLIRGTIQLVRVPEGVAEAVRTAPRGWRRRDKTPARLPKLEF